MTKLEVAKRIVEHGSCAGQTINCGDCPAIAIVLNNKASYCTINWDKESNLSGYDYAAARKNWFENWIKDNDDQSKATQGK